MRSSLPAFDPDEADRPTRSSRSVAPTSASRATGTLPRPELGHGDSREPGRTGIGHREGHHHEVVDPGLAVSDKFHAEWTVQLARRQPAKLVGVLAGVAGASALGWMTFDSWIGGVIGGGLVFSAVAEFVLPIRYRLTHEGAFCSYGLARLAIPWSSVKRVIVGAGSLGWEVAGLRVWRLGAIVGDYVGRDGGVAQDSVSKESAGHAG